MLHTKSLQPRILCTTLIVIAKPSHKVVSFGETYLLHNIIIILLIFFAFKIKLVYRTYKCISETPVVLSNDLAADIIIDGIF